MGQAEIFLGGKEGLLFLFQCHLESSIALSCRAGTVNKLTIETQASEAEDKQTKTKKKGKDVKRTESSVELRSNYNDDLLLGSILK